MFATESTVNMDLLRYTDSCVCWVGVWGCVGGCVYVRVCRMGVWGCVC